MPLVPEHIPRADQDRTPDVCACKCGKEKPWERDADKASGDADQSPHAGDHASNQNDPGPPLPALLFDFFDVFKMKMEELRESIHKRTASHPCDPVGNGCADRASQPRV